MRSCIRACQKLLGCDLFAYVVAGANYVKDELCLRDQVCVGA